MVMSRTAKDVETELKRIGRTLSPLEIVVVNTSAGTAYGRPDYVLQRLRNGTRGDAVLAGTWRAGDGHRWLELDAPFIHTMKKYAEARDASLIWGHRAGRAIGYCHIEKLHNLEALPARESTWRFRRLDKGNCDH